MLPLPIKVTCAIIEKNGKILIAQRANGKHLAGFWEFPGGKLEPDETPKACLIREIKEELNLDVEPFEALPAFQHQYSNKTIELLPFRCKLIGGQLKLADHSAIEWMELEKLPEMKLAPADVPVLDHLITVKSPKKAQP